MNRTWFIYVAVLPARDSSMWEGRLIKYSIASITIAAAILTMPASSFAQRVGAMGAPGVTNPNPPPPPPPPKHGGSWREDGARLEDYRNSLEDFRASTEAMRERNGEAGDSYRRNIEDYRKGMDIYRSRKKQLGQ